jgi:hypothetical protein
VERRKGSVLEGEHHLEEGSPAQGALGSEFLDEALEGDVLVGEGAEGGVANLLQQGAEGRVSVEASAEGEGVDEETDEGLGLGEVPVGDGSADDDVLAAAVAVEQRVERSQQRHEEGGALGVGEGLERGDEGGGKGEGEVGAAEGLSRRAGPVGGQLEGGRNALEVVSPPGELGGEGVAGEELTLPGGEVGVLDGQFGQGRGKA